jgi:uncharacterized protein (DUF1684 family)
MKHIFSFIFIYIIGNFSILIAQSHIEIYENDLAKHRKNYKEEFINHPRSPITAADTSFIQFYPPDHSWNIAAAFSETPESKAFELPTYSGLTRTYRQYGKLNFHHKGIDFTLSIYQNLSLMKDTSYKNYLFLPFTDLTNGSTTYEGGRYLDFSIGDIHHQTMHVDFNKSYNPYCAYSDGYNCPVPPAENRLNIEIPVGEKKFLKERKH